jgi:glycosyltransferase involved in cell wall biosynthesis
MKRNSIVFIATGLTKSTIADYFVSLANELQFSTRVVIVTNTENQYNSSINDDVIVERWPSKRPTKFKDFIFLVRLVIKHKPNVMISNFGAVNLFLIVGFLFGISNRYAWHRTLSYFSSQDFHKGAIYRKKMVYRLATRLIANSNATKEDLISNFSVRENKISVVYNAVKDPELNEEIDSNQLVYVGRMHPSKGIDVLLKALPHVVMRYPNIRVLLVGGNVHGNEIEEFLAIAHQLDVARFVNFVGNKPKDQVLKFFASSYLSIVPSYAEAFGNVIIESFSVGTPVIGSNNTGISEIIKDGVDGLLFETKNEVDLANKINYMLERPNERKLMSINCKNRFNSEFTLIKNVKKVKGLILESVG